MLVKSDVLAVTPYGSLYPSSADMLSTALIYLPDTSPMDNGCGKHAGMNSMYCPSHNAVYENIGFAPSIVVDRALQLHYIATLWCKIFSHYMITDSAAPTNKCRNLSTVLQLPRVLSSTTLLLMMLTKNFRFLDALTHSMKWVILPTFYRVGPHSGESYSKLWKWMSCWSHLDLQFR